MLPPKDYKLARFFRLQFAPAQTAKNRARVKAGQRPIGRPAPCLVSWDFHDLYMVQVSWTATDAAPLATQGPYFAVYLDGEYWPLPHSGVSATTIKTLIDSGKLSIVPKESS